MKAKIHITLKNGVLDPQGQAIAGALGHLGFNGVNNVRVGKYIEMELAEGTPKEQITAMCDQLLANTVIENYAVEM
jgi:phosphoribosylformylglycinamidine synthase